MNSCIICRKPNLPLGAVMCRHCQERTYPRESSDLGFLPVMCFCFAAFFVAVIVWVFQ